MTPRPASVVHADDPESGTSLVETLIALTVLVIAVAGLLSMVTLTAKVTEDQGHLAARATEYAQDKMEQLLALKYEDATSNTAVFPATTAGGTGLAIGGSSNPAATVAGYVDWLSANGDLHIDAHHTVEDIGITIGQALAQALGDKKGLRRYGHAYVPLDEALSRVVLDLSGRPGLSFFVDFKRAMIGTFDVDLTHEFFQGQVNHALMTVHIDNLRGENAHHQAETIFKAFGRALRMATELDSRAADSIPSTKGTL